jgi:hypothetical protein
MRLTLYFTLFFLFGFWVTNFAMYFAKMNLTPQSVVDYYLGSEAEFRMPRTYQSMLEVTRASADDGHGHAGAHASADLLIISTAHESGVHLDSFFPLSSRGRWMAGALRRSHVCVVEGNDVRHCRSRWHFCWSAIGVSDAICKGQDNGGAKIRIELCSGGNKKACEKAHSNAPCHPNSF